MRAFTCVVVFMFASAYAQGVQVNTTEGVVEGYRANDGDYYEFYGIPYAGPTVGINRFKAPLPPPVHPGVFYANDSNIICAQPSPRGLIGVENCLALNIFTNNVTTSKPVIVWLNAEDYTTTSTEIPSFRRIVEEDLVFVSLNFRLSIFGFLCLGIEEAPGNAGLRDVIQGLKWIKSNIHNFGGNSSNIVLMGHASGAAIVDLITMAPQAKGLVHKAVALSGSSLASWAVAYDPVGYAELLGAKLRYTWKSKESLANHLMATDNILLNSALVEFLHFKNNTPLFAPCIENTDLNPNDTILADAPLNLLRSGNYLQIPYIAGYTTREGTMRANEIIYDNWLNAMNENFTAFLPVDLDINCKRNIDAVSDIKDFYFRNITINMEHVDDFLKYQGDSLVVVPVIRGAKERAVNSTGKVRLLGFGYLGAPNLDWDYKQIPLKGVRHGGMLPYLFDYDLKPQDKPVMTSLVKRFVTFAYTGSQNMTTAPPVWGWLPVTTNYTNSLYYSPRVGDIYFEDADEFPHDGAMFIWNDAFYQCYRLPRPVNSSDEQLHSNIAGKHNSVGCNTISLYVIYITVIFAMLSQVSLRL